MILIRFRFDFGWIWLDFDSILDGFCLIGGLIALVALEEVPGGPRILGCQLGLLGLLGRSLGKSYRKVTRVRRVMKCIVDCKIDHLAS